MQSRFDLDTPENQRLIKRIQKGDKAAVTKFYADNLKHFRAFANGFVYKQKYKGVHRYEPDDCVSQVFLDLPLDSNATPQNSPCF